MLQWNQLVSEVAKKTRGDILTAVEFIGLIITVEVSVASPVRVDALTTGTLKFTHATLHSAICTD